jgi:rare lipoprotein A
MKALLLLLGCTVLPMTVTAAEKKPFTQTGTASWYGNEFKGHKMANGARYNPEDMTAAHRTLPFGTQVRVTNLRNNHCTVVKITNRGPYIKRRIIDVSRAAARALNMMKSGTARVRIEVVLDELAQAKSGG